jgi:hypothetical protein
LTCFIDLTFDRHRPDSLSYAIDWHEKRPVDLLSTMHRCIPIHDMRESPRVDGSAFKRDTHPINSGATGVSDIVSVGDEGRDSERAAPAHRFRCYPVGLVEQCLNLGVGSVSRVGESDDDMRRVSSSLKLAKRRAQGEHRRNAIREHALLGLPKQPVKAVVSLPQARNSEDDCVLARRGTPP